ncbi:unnamed protein product [Diamesa tonsa]
MQDDNYNKLEKVLMKIAFIPLNRQIDLTVSDYKILRKVKALKAKLKSSPSTRRSSVIRAVEPIAQELPSNIVENLVESHIEEESSEARNVNNLQNEFSEFLHPGSIIENVGNEYSNNSISLPMNQIPIPSSIEVNLSDINSIGNINPPRVEVNYEEEIETRPEVYTPEIDDDFGNADLDDIRSLGFEQNIMSSTGNAINIQSVELLHRSSILYPRSSMREGVSIPQIILDGVGLESSSGASVSRHLLANSTPMSPQNHGLLEKSGIAMPECNRTPMSLAASSVIIPPFSGIEHEDSLSPTNEPQPDDTLSRVSTNSRRLLIFNNIQETLPVQAPQQRRRRAQRVHDYDPDILNIDDDLMVLNGPAKIPESIMRQPHKSPRLFKTPSFIDIDLTFEFDLLKISKENPQQQNLPTINYFDDDELFNPNDNDIQERPAEPVQDFDSIQQRPSVPMQNLNTMQPPRSSTLPLNYKLQEQLSVSTPAEEIAAENITSNVTQRITVRSPVEVQNELEERSAEQNLGKTPTNLVPATSISITYDAPDVIRRMTMNTPTGIPDMSYNFQQFKIDNQQNASRISELNEVPIPPIDEDLAPAENYNRQRLPSYTNQQPNNLQKLKPHKKIIHQGQRFVQFEDGQKFSVYFLELTFLFYEIQQLFVRNGVHTMDADELIQEIRKDETVQCIRIQLLNLCHNNLIDIIDDDDGEIAAINIPFLGTTVQ